MKKNIGLEKKMLLHRIIVCRWRLITARATLADAVSHFYQDAVSSRLNIPSIITANYYLNF